MKTLTHISLIGGSGFIGSRFTKRMESKEDYKIEIIDKKKSESFPSISKITDIRFLSQLNDAVRDESIIINLAAEHRDDVKPESLYDEVNIGGAENICAVARNKNVNRIIFTSSVAVYGFAPVGTNEDGEINPFNDYGRTKYEAEKIFKVWQAESPNVRTLVIIRPTVVFGEQNRGNVYNLLRQISSGKFIMVGNGENRKSMVYVENVAAFIEFGLKFGPGIHIFNCVDKPDFTMNQLVLTVRRSLGISESIKFRLPFFVGVALGRGFDLVAHITGRRFPVSAIRVKKFCSNSVYSTAIDKTDFVPPVSILHALEKTIRHEFIDSSSDGPLFFSE